MTRPPGPIAGIRRAVTRARVTAAPAGTPPGRGLPLLVDRAGGPAALAAWAADHADLVRTWLHQHGAVFFRGFDVGLDAFPWTVRALAGEPVPYLQRSSPRSELGDRVYSATDHPADQHIALHGENSYQDEFPAALVLCCLTPPDRGGQTPVADARRVLARIPAEVLEPFIRLGVGYLRNFGGGLGLPWQEAFQTRDRARIDELCAARGIECEWRTGGRLRTWQVRPALAVHPVTGEEVWFNHALFFNAASLPPQIRRTLLESTPLQELPQHTYYGDCSPISAEALEAVAAAYAAEEVTAPWRQGDVMLVDNLLAAHGRRPFSGPRRIAVSLAGHLAWSDVDAGTRRGSAP